MNFKWLNKRPGYATDIAYLILSNLLVVCLFKGAFSISFVQDDWVVLDQIMQSLNGKGFSLGAALSATFHAPANTYYRLIQTLYYIFAFKFFGMAAWKWHVFNFSFFICVGIVYFYFLSLLGCSRFTRYAAHLFFISSWTNFRILYWLADIHDIVSALTVILSISAYIMYRKRGKPAYAAIALGFYLLGFIVKENASLLPFALVALELICLGKLPRPEGKAGLASLGRKWGLLSVFLALVVAFVSLVLILLPRFHGDGYKMAIGWHMITHASDYLLWATAPDLKRAYMTLGMAFAGLLLSWVKGKSEPSRARVNLALFGLLWFAIFLAPFFFITVQEYPDYLLLPRVGFSLFLAASLDSFIELFSNYKMRVAALCLLAALFIKIQVKNEGRVAAMNSGGETISWMSKTTWQNLSEFAMARSDNPKVKNIAIICAKDADFINSCDILKSVQHDGAMFRIYFNNPEIKVSYHVAGDDVTGADAVFNYKNGEMRKMNPSP